MTPRATPRVTPRGTPRTTILSLDSCGPAALPQLLGPPLRVSDLDQSEQTESWIRRPMYYTHHLKPEREQLSQVIQLPPTQRCHRFKASAGASWEPLADNATVAAQKHPLHHITATVLLCVMPCNPFHLGEIDCLKRAKAAIEAFPHVAVIGALIVPHSDADLRQRGVTDDRRLPFALRRALARSVIEAAGQENWVIVDSCLEGCMQHVPGSIAPFVSVYARGRLHGSHYDVRVVELRTEDPVEGPVGCRPFGHLRVAPHTGGDAAPHISQGLTLGAVSTVVVDAPKQSQCDDLLWSAVRNPQDRSLLVSLERLCGAAGAKLIAEWAKERGKFMRGKSTLLASSG